METRDMLVFDHLLYKTHVYGRNMAASYKKLFSYNKVKTLPNGVPTMKIIIFSLFVGSILSIVP
ncbi:hypothetical protein DPMN_019041 [Dreissena polymorpha]|uniref:Uncharacterized protein n=1 Tax=Dreissena polymorpha TaxID=45954 RepID=A0A9D4NIF7_DREPO|nr:hypothetical protein DPMN_019041 [Dreissena polymorpha]